MSIIIKLADVNLLEMLTADLNLSVREEMRTQSPILTIRDLIRGTMSTFKTNLEETLSLRKTRRGQVTKLANRLWDPIHATFSGDEGDQLKLTSNVLSKMILDFVTCFTEPELREHGALVMLTTSSIQKGNDNPANSVKCSPTVQSTTLVSPTTNSQKETRMSPISLLSSTPGGPPMIDLTINEPLTESEQYVTPLTENVKPKVDRVQGEQAQGEERREGNQLTGEQAAYYSTDDGGLEDRRLHRNPGPPRQFCTRPPTMPLMLLFTTPDPMAGQWQVPVPYPTGAPVPYPRMPSIIMQYSSVFDACNCGHYYRRKPPYSSWLSRLERTRNGPTGAGYPVGS